jgi:hypothetical protein
MSQNIIAAYEKEHRNDQQHNQISGYFLHAKALHLVERHLDGKRVWFILQEIFHYFFI